MATKTESSWSLRRLYGVRLRTTVPIGEAVETPYASDRSRSAADDRSVDWTIDWCDAPRDPTVPPEGSPVVDEGVWPANRHGDVVTLWHDVLGRVTLDLAARHIALGLTERTDEVAALLLRGIVLSLALELTGVPTLHANGVLVGDEAVAVAGPRGAGKTTVTAALCAAGAELLSDDVVPLDRPGSGDRGGDRWAARSGLTQLRLRGGAAHLAALIGDRYPQQASVDGRHVVVLPTPSQERVPLQAIVVPRIADVGQAGLVRLSGREAFAHVAVAFRIATFLEPTLLVARLGVTAALVTDVPVFALEMPVIAQWDLALAVELRALFESTFAGVPR